MDLASLPPLPVRVNHYLVDDERERCDRMALGIGLRLGRIRRRTRDLLHAWRSWLRSPPTLGFLQLCGGSSAAGISSNGSERISCPDGTLPAAASNCES
jgi:hypothetical protein